MSSSQVHVPAAHEARRSRSMWREQPEQQRPRKSYRKIAAREREASPGGRARGVEQRREQPWAGSSRASLRGKNASEGRRKPAVRTAL